MEAAETAARRQRLLELERAYAGLQQRQRERHEGVAAGSAMTARGAATTVIAGGMGPSTLEGPSNSSREGVEVEREEQVVWAQQVHSQRWLAAMTREGVAQAALAAQGRGGMAVQGGEEGVEQAASAAAGRSAVAAGIPPTRTAAGCRGTDTPSEHRLTASAAKAALTPPRSGQRQGSSDRGTERLGSLGDTGRCNCM